MQLPYVIDYSSTDKGSFEIQPGQVDTTSTSLSLPGRGRSDYGELYDENLVHMLEHFASDTAPLSPTTGQLWYDTTEHAIKMFDSTTVPNWRVLLSSNFTDRLRIPVVATLPTTDLTAGDVVFLSTSGKLHVYDGSAWRALASESWVTSSAVIDGGTVAFV